MKFFRLTWAEIKKIICKPTFFIMAICVFVAITLSAFLYSPARRISYDTALSGSTISSIYSSFTRAGQQDGKDFSHDLIQAQVESIKNFNNLDDLQQLKDKICVTFKSNFYALENAIQHASYNKSTLQNLYNSSRQIFVFLNERANLDRQTDYLIPYADFENMRNVFKSLFSALPAADAIENLTADQIETYCKGAWEFKGKIDKILSKCQALEKLTLTEKFLDSVDLLQTQILSNLAQQEEKIEQFYQNSLDKNNDPETILRFKKILSDYKATVQISCLLLSNNLDINLLEKVGGNASDYLGFEDVSFYQLKEQTTFYSYIIENNVAYSTTLTNFNFDQNSGFEKNGFDFAYFLLCVASLLINLILIYFACMTFSGERHDGLMRMNMTKPISRSKLYFAKLTALVALSLAAHLIFGLLFTLIGVLIYGSASGSILIAVFGGTSAFVTSPIAMIFLKICTLFLTSLFYVLVASLISNIFSNPVFSLVMTYLVYIFAIVTNTLLNKMAFIKSLPFIHTDLSAFFGGGIWQGKFLGSLIYSGASFPLSIVYFAVSCILLATIGCILINRQEN